LRLRYILFFVLQQYDDKSKTVSDGSFVTIKHPTLVAPAGEMVDEKTLAF